MDSRGHLWVAERNQAPKCVGIWTAEGRLHEALIGPSKYGGGGFIDPQDRFDARTLAPQNVIYARAGRYSTNGYSASPTSAGPVVTLWRQADDLTLRPAAVVAAAADWPLMLRDEFFGLIAPELVRRRRNPAPDESDIESISAAIAWSDSDGCCFLRRRGAP